MRERADDGGRGGGAEQVQPEAQRGEHQGHAGQQVMIAILQIIARVGGNRGMW